MKSSTERIAVIETKVNLIQSDVSDIKKMIQDHTDACDRRYASKWTEKAVITLLLTVVGAVITALVTLL